MVRNSPTAAKTTAYTTYSYKKLVLYLMSIDNVRLFVFVEVSSLSTNLYSNDCFIVNKEGYDNGKRISAKSNEESIFLKEVERQRDILAMDDIEDSSSDETDVKKVPLSNNNSVSKNSCTQDSAKSEIIVIDSDNDSNE